MPATVLGDETRQPVDNGIITSAGLFDGSFVNLTFLRQSARES